MDTGDQTDFTVEEAVGLDTRIAGYEAWHLGLTEEDAPLVGRERWLLGWRQAEADA